MLAKRAHCSSEDPKPSSQKVEGHLKIIDEVEEVLHTCGNEKVQPLQIGNLNQTQLEEPYPSKNETLPLGIANISQAFPMSDASMAFQLQNETQVFGQANEAAAFF